MHVQAPCTPLLLLWPYAHVARNLLSDGSPHSEPLIIARAKSCQFADHFVQFQPIKMTSEWIDKHFPQDLVNYLIQNLYLLSILITKRMLLYIKSHPLPFLIGHQLRKWRVWHEALIAPDMQTSRNRYHSGSGAIMNKLWPATVIMDWKWLKIEHAEPERWRFCGIHPMKRGRHFGGDKPPPYLSPSVQTMTTWVLSFPCPFTLSLNLF